MSKYVALDTETSGIDVFNDRVVTAFVGLWDTDENRFVQHLEFLVNPGIEIPQAATDVHGVTNEMASKGMDPVEFLEILFYVLHDWAEYPIVVMNANYDLSLINAELERYGYTAFDWTKRQIIDPLVIDRGNDRYRKGSRKLVNLAEHYGVDVDESKAHDAAYDCYLAVGVAVEQIKRYGESSNEQQAAWFESWRSNFEQWLQRTNPEATVDRGWPTRLKEEA